jgi:hypothetical protein
MDREILCARFKTRVRCNLKGGSSRSPMGFGDMLRLTLEDGVYDVYFCQQRVAEIDLWKQTVAD